MFRESFEKLQAYVEEQGYRGWDPYDGLNSKLFQALPFFKNSRLARLAWIQAFKRSPINFRDLTGVEKAYNPKGLGLLLSGYCKLYQMDRSQEVRSRIHFLSDKLLELQSHGWSGACWGYNFDWQARAFFQPKGTPSVVVTSFVGNALLDAYQSTGRGDLFETAVTTKDFIAKDLNRSYQKDGSFCFSYSPKDHAEVFNASLLGSKMLARIYRFTKDEETADLARKSVSFCVNCQKGDGSWAYGTLPYHAWVDSFHTGFNLEALAGYRLHTGDPAFDESIRLGLRYYLNNFFTDRGIPKYYGNSAFPIDIHCAAQLPITLCSLGVLQDHGELVRKVLEWTITNLQDDKGYFYFQFGKWVKNKIPYIRWAQAWMFLSLASYLLETFKKPEHEETDHDYGIAR